MKITFLGTGTSQGVPVIGCRCAVCRSLDFRDKRLRTSVHIQDGDTSIIVDSGPDFRQQVLRERITRLDAVVYTHQHKDHTAGLDDIRSFNFLQGVDIPVYGRKQVLEQLKQEFAYIFAKEKYPGIPRIALNEIINEPFFIKDTRLTPVEVLHHKLPVFGFRIKDFTYITDANYISDQELEKVKGSRVIVLDALQQSEHISHFTLSEAVEILQKLKPEKAYLTHLSHKMGLYREVEQSLPDFISIAWDGLKVEL